MSFYSDQTKQFIGQLDITADYAIDFGGSQNPVKKRVRSWNVQEYRILDLEKPHNVTQLPDIVANLNDPINATERYDVGFCFDVMEYIWNPIVALQNINQFLNKNGILYINFPFIYPYHNPIADDCLRYTRTGVMKLLRHTGFKILVGIEIKAKEPWKLIDFYKSDGMHVASDSAVTGFIIKCMKL